MNTIPAPRATKVDPMIALRCANPSVIATSNKRCTQNPVQRLFDVGDILLYSTIDSPLVMWDVDRPKKKRGEIWELFTKAAAGRFQS
jgi:hypothetical protein